jgi:beta-phosphoglucomutase-like phosphatase (HAD superfamily)
MPDRPHSGLLIDLDGTLADSLSVMRTVYRRFLSHLGKSGSDTEFQRLNGPPLPEIVADLARTHAIDLPVDSLLEIYWQLLDGVYLGVLPRKGAAELLRTACEHRIRVAVVTSNASGLTRNWLRVAGLEDMVEVIVGGDDVRRGKPDPEPYLLALERMGCDAAASLAVEDSEAGASSAVAAGIPTLLLADSETNVPSAVVVVDCLDSVARIMRDWLILGVRR